MRFVVFFYEFLISDDFGGFIDGSLFVRVVEEVNVDVCVGGEVVGFVWFGIGVEEEVEFVVFLELNVNIWLLMGYISVNLFD